MSADISPLLVRTPAAARPLWLRLRRSSPFTLTVLMCCLALLWISPFIWMLATSFSATTFGEDMASLLPRLPLTLDNFRDAWNSADWLSLYANTLIFTFGTFFVQLLTITTAGYQTTQESGIDSLAAKYDAAPNAAVQDELAAMKAKLGLQ